MATASEKYKQFKQQYETARKQMLQQAGDAFKEFASDLFSDFPKLKSFGWTQYSPYFNDGDECVFSVNNDASSIRINGRDMDGCCDGDDEEVSTCTKCENELTDTTAKFCDQCGTAVPKEDIGMDDKEHERAAKATAKMLQQFEDAVLQDLYGNHVEVTVHRDGRAVVDSYDHD
jgi:hypothetical protein